MQSARGFGIILGWPGISYLSLFSLSLSPSPPLSTPLREIGSRYVIVNPIDQKFAHVPQCALTVRRDIEWTGLFRVAKQPVDVLYPIKIAVGQWEI